MRGSDEPDLAADPLLGATLALADAAAGPVVVDLTEVTFCGSCVLGQLPAAGRRITGDGRQMLVATSQYVVLRPLTLLGLDRDITIVPDVETAVRRLTQSLVAAVDPATDTTPEPA
ncbi:STAS domain-containing protein [Amycolatopsis sp. NBC_01307]|uniref:STAS domain-containing protein n=1 Tax=Amycolatopsis sp. NBC_01307 TaxID=2903561 RepID=UPI002E145E69|nr:STAS domain-containing protein [Amycolatopsis sp. NBC_01307]